MGHLKSGVVIVLFERHEGTVKCILAAVGANTKATVPIRVPDTGGVDPDSDPTVQKKKQDSNPTDRTFGFYPRKTA